MRRIGLIGAECSGKSTLAQDLARTLPACVTTEQLRAFVNERERNPEVSEQLGLMLDQQRAEDEVAAACGLGVVIGDSAPLMIAVYSVNYFDDATLIDRAVDLARGYDLMLWCDIDLPWEADGIQRDGPDVRAREHELIAELVRNRIRPAGIKVELLSGSAGNRAEAAGRAWQLAGPHLPT